MEKLALHLAIHMGCSEDEKGLAVLVEIVAPGYQALTARRLHQGLIPDPEAAPGYERLASGTLIFRLDMIQARLLQGPEAQFPLLAYRRSREGNLKDLERFTLTRAIDGHASLEGCACAS